MLNWVKESADTIQFNVDSYTEPELTNLVVFLLFHKWKCSQEENFTTTFTIYK